MQLPRDLRIGQRYKWSMPLHEWSETTGWEGVRHLWIDELLRYIKARLPAGYRAFLGFGPTLAVGAPPVKPDISVRTHPAQGASVEAGWQGEPDVEVAVAVLEPIPALHVERDGRLVAAVELVSPRNKDRPVSRATYLGRYAGYLIEGVHLLLVDVHARPAGFSFADAIAAELQLPAQPALPPPMAIAFRVGEPAATGGRLLALWRFPLSAGATMPTVPLPLDVGRSVPVDLEATYMRAAAEAYLA